MLQREVAAPACRQEGNADWRGLGHRGMELPICNVSDDRLGCPSPMLPDVLRRDICLGAVESRSGGVDDSREQGLTGLYGLIVSGTRILNGDE